MSVTYRGIKPYEQNACPHLKQQACLDCEDCDGWCWQVQQMTYLPNYILKSKKPTKLNKSKQSVKL